VKRAAVSVAFATARREELRFGFLRLRERKFRRDREESVEFGVELLDSPQQQLRQFNRGQLALAKELSDLFDGGEREIAVAQAQNIFS
jgi:hypothetical protein